jgi:hypothetical protein
LTQPPDAREAQDEIYKLKALKQTGADDHIKKQREEQQREAPKVLLGKLKSQYSQATYTWMYCSYLSMQACGQTVGYGPCGCNETERNGNYWYEENKHVVRIVFPADNTILFITGTGYAVLKGTPRGPGMEDIAWEANTAGIGAPVWKPAWVQSSSGLDRIMCSGGSFGNIWPLDGGLFNHLERYKYDFFKKR